MSLFGKKKKELFPETTQTPLPLVIQLRQQGYSDNQIVQYLQKQGYSSTQVFDALSQADIKKTIQPVQEDYPEQPQEFAQPQQQQSYPQPPSMPPAPVSPQESSSKEEIEQVAETIIDEKWDELKKGVDKIIAWKDSAEAKILKIETEMEELKKRFSELHTGILGKISEYDAGIRDVGTDIKAMQEVFKKTLPQFTENIAALERLTKKAKK